MGYTITLGINEAIYTYPYSSKTALYFNGAVGKNLTYPAVELALKRRNFATAFPILSGNYKTNLILRVFSETDMSLNILITYCPHKIK